MAKAHSAPSWEIDSSASCWSRDHKIEDAIVTKAREIVVFKGLKDQHHSEERCERRK